MDKKNLILFLICILDGVLDIGCHLNTNQYILMDGFVFSYEFLETLSFKSCIQCSAYCVRSNQCASVNFRRNGNVCQCDLNRAGSSNDIYLEESTSSHYMCKQSLCLFVFMFRPNKQISEIDSLLSYFTTINRPEKLIQNRNGIRNSGFKRKSQHYILKHMVFQLCQRKTESTGGYLRFLPYKPHQNH